VKGIVALLDAGDLEERLWALGRIEASLRIAGFAAGVVRAFSDSNPDVREAAKGCLVILPASTLRPLLVTLALSGEDPGRSMARNWLMGFGSHLWPSSSRWLTILLTGTEADRARVIRDLAEQGQATPDVIAALMCCLKDPSASIREHAEKALKYLRE
jgi:hypothetical protein